MKRWLHLTFGADLRSLAAMRMGTALVLIFDLLNRCFWVRDHYYDFGSFSRADSVLVGSNYIFCLHNLSGHWVFGLLMLLLHLGAASCLLLGYRTRLVTVVCWGLLVSLHHRNPTLLLGADPWLRSILFWGMFLPWGQRWSIDAPLEKEETSVFSAATAGLVLQVCTVYLVAGWMKQGASWWPDGTAIADTLRILEFRPSGRDISDYLLYFPDFLKVLTYLTLGLEKFGILLLFAPFFTAALRTLVLVGLMLFHVGLALGLNLHIFPWIGVACLLGLLPGSCWERFPLRSIATRLTRWTLRRPTWRGADPRVELGRAWNLALWSVTLLTLLWNAQFLRPFYQFPRPLAELMIAAGFKQNWSLFAPNAPKSSSIILPVAYDAEGQEHMLRVDGRERDIFTLQEAFGYLRWRQHHLYLITSNNGWARTTYCQYLARRYFAERGEWPERIRLYRVTRPSLEGFEDAPLRKVRLYEFLVPQPPKEPEPAEAERRNSLSPPSAPGPGTGGLPEVLPSESPTPEAEDPNSASNLQL